MTEAYTGGCAAARSVMNLRRTGGDEPLPVSRLSAQERHRARILSDLRGRKGVKLTGKAQHWDIAGDSGNVKTRAFCPTCGSPVYLTFAAMPDCSPCTRRVSMIRVDSSRRW